MARIDYFPSYARRRAALAKPPGGLGGVVVTFFGYVAPRAGWFPERPDPYYANDCSLNRDWVVKFGPLLLVAGRGRGPPS